MPFLAEERVDIPNKDILSWIFDAPEYDLDKPAYVDALKPSRSISARQAKGIVRKLVAGFHAAGLKKGDCVCIHSFNDIQYSMLFLGIVGAGGIFTGTNPSYTQYEMAHHIKHSQVKFIISEPELISNVLAASKECSIPTSNIWIFDVLGQEVPAGFKSWEHLKTYGEEDWVRFDDETVSKNTTAARLFSSGTTGLPKAAILSHYNLVAEHTLVHERVVRPYEIKRALCLPLFHASLVPTAHTSTLKSGHTAYVLRRFELETYLSITEKYEITDITLVPPLVIAIIMSPLSKKYSLRAVRSGSCGAAPLSKDAQEKLKSFLSPDAVFTQVWGMTETSCVASMFVYPESDDTGSVGRIVPNLDVKLIDEDGNDITAYDIRGELCIRGPTVIPGYFENPAANAEAFDSEGFMRTGDIMYCDSKSKKWYVVDRRKELIKVRGFQVAPAELEGVLLTHPQIIDAAVIGITLPEVKDAECPRAYIVRRPGPEGAKLTEKDVKAFCDEKLARYKDLTGGVAFVDAIPKNASGKILKRILRDMVKTGLRKNGVRL